MNELDSMCGISDEELVEGRKCKNIDCGCGKNFFRYMQTSARTIKNL